MSGDALDRHGIATVRRRSRLLMLLDAAERAATTPIASRRIHAFAYLADVLSPVWGLPSFDGKILKIDGGPHYPELQEELDHLVVMGLAEISNLSYAGRGAGARIEGNYALNFASPHLEDLLAALGTGPGANAIDVGDLQVNAFLVELAGALATLPNDQIDRATEADVTYRAEGKSGNVIDFADWAVDRRAANPTWRTADRFEEFMPEDTTLTGGEKLYLYAAYLGRLTNG